MSTKRVNEFDLVNSPHPQPNSCFVSRIGWCGKGSSSLGHQFVLLTAAAFVCRGAAADKRSSKRKTRKEKCGAPAPPPPFCRRLSILREGKHPGNFANAGIPGVGAEEGRSQADLWPLSSEKGASVSLRESSRFTKNTF